MRLYKACKHNHTDSFYYVKSNITELVVEGTRESAYLRQVCSFTVLELLALNATTLLENF